MKKILRALSTSQLIAAGFALLILIGAALLSLPAANRAAPLSFLDALFTACSAACVTGLVAADTWTQFTGLGQAVLLVLIQIGGLGFLTFAVLFSMALGRRIGLRERINLSEAVGAKQLGGVVRLAKRIALGAFIVELAGAALLSVRFIPRFGVGTGIWYSVFHSISAFCNAGFDLMGSVEPYSSLVCFADDAVVNLTVMALIIIGGIGFIVWDDICENGPRFKKYALHTKLVLTASAALIVLFTALFLITERAGVFKGMAPGERLLAALFCAVSPRTAGFNTVDLAALSEGGSLMTILLMFIGAGSGSTGGGLKVSTLAVLLLTSASYIRRRPEVNAFGRRIEPDAVRKAFCVTALFILMLFAGTLIITANQTISLKDALFECVSALGTVGLTLGATRDLTALSRVVVLLLMYCGRVGSLTIFMAVSSSDASKQPRYPAEKVIIG